MDNQLNLSVAAVLRSEETGSALSRSCRQLNGHKIDVHVGELRSVRPEVAALRNSNVLLLDVDPRDPEEMGLLDDIIHRHFPGKPIIVTAKDFDLADVRRLMRVGVVDVLPQPITEIDIKSAIERSIPLQRIGDVGDAKLGKVISFLKSGGGAGATTICVQLGCILASQDGDYKSKVGLFDLDLQFGTAALYLDLDHRVGLPDLLDAPERLDSDLLDSVTTRHQSGLEVLAAPNDVLPLDALSQGFVTSILRVSRRDYEYTLLDLPDAWTDWSRSALEKSDLIVLVTQLSVSGIRRARRQLDTLKATDLDQIPVHVVVNRFNASGAKTVSIKEAEKALGRKIDSVVRSDFHLVSEAQDLGVALSAIKKKTKVEMDLKKMTKALMDGFKAKEQNAAKSGGEIRIDR